LSFADARNKFDVFGFYFDTILKYFIICKKNSYITEKKERKTGRKGEVEGKE
jgi:hypothetical protein